MTAAVWTLLLAYLFGSIPAGVLVARTYGVDIRKVGSGNIGATNVLRALGWGPALVVAFFDVFKGGIAVLVAEATSFRFDGSDLMPGEVGAGSFWTGMTSWVSGAADLETVLAEIDASWPED